VGWVVGKFVQWLMSSFTRSVCVFTARYGKQLINGTASVMSDGLCAAHVILHGIDDDIVDRPNNGMLLY